MEQHPRAARPLPDGSPVAPEAPLGVCARCSVAACSLHAARPGRFECAICEPASATEQALLGPDGDSQLKGQAFAFAHAIGERASGELQDRTAKAVEQILADGARAREGGRDAHMLIAEGLEDGEPNLVGDLAGEIRRRMGVGRGDPREFVAQAQVERAEAEFAEAGSGDQFEWEGASPTDSNVGVIQLDAIGASVAATFAGSDLRVDSASIPALTGALLAAMATADRRSYPLGPGAHPEQIASVEVKAPWVVSYPVLLDPVMWMVATAYIS